MANRTIDAMPQSEMSTARDQKSRHRFRASIDVVRWKNGAQMRNASVTIT